ncbi:MAG: flavodoxin family protein [Coprobacillaceae bacterium]
MKQIVVYNSKHGAVKDVVKLIKERVPEVIIHNIKEGIPNINEYERIIIGTNVTAGQIDKDLKLFCETKEVLSKEIILFVSGLSKSIEEVLKQNFNEQFLSITK